jgi:hypothetical protein
MLPLRQKLATGIARDFPLVRAWQSSTTTKTTTTTTTTTIRRFVPHPTWSVTDDLALHERHAKIDVATFHLLCRRACLLPLEEEEEDDDNSTLRQDVGNMMHMMNQVVRALSEIVPAGDDKKYSISDIYDRPRGVTAAPGVVEAATGVADVESSSTAASVDASTDKSWLETMRESKMKRVGGHYYFEIETTTSSKQ